MENQQLLVDRRTTNEDQIPKWRSLVEKFPVRHIIYTLTLLGFINAFAVRSLLGVVIVDMVANKTVNGLNGTITFHQDFNWNTKQQGMVLSSFYWGYATVQFLLGAILPFVFGGKAVLGVSIFAPSVISCVVPYLTHLGDIYLLFTLRLLQGCFEGSSLPAMINFMSKWTPMMERSFMYSFVASGFYTGTFVGLTLTGIIIKRFNWEAPFYIYGATGILWYIPWQFFVKETPEEHPSVSDVELQYIQSNRQTDSVTRLKLSEIPIRKILLSKPVWAISISMFTEHWGLYTIVTEFPTYLSTVFGIDISNVGIYTGVPYITLIVILLFNGWLLDFIRKRNVIKISNLRKVFVCFGFGCQIVFYFCLISSNSVKFSVICMCFAVGFGSTAIAGYGPVILELSPKYSAAIMCLANTTASIGGIFAPIVCGYLISDGDATDWSLVFYIIIIVYFLGGAAFVILGSSEIQDWDNE